MIQANELRVGNWVDHFGNYGQVETIKKDGVIFLVYGKLKQGDFGNVIEALEPIPLTPEILEKCGFSKYNTVNLWIKGDFYLHRYLWPDNQFCFKYNDFKSSSIKYLHQLQNLYFALTGEELTFKP